MLSSDVFVIKSQVLCLQRAYFKNKIQGSVVPRSIMTNMNYFEYQYGTSHSAYVATETESVVAKIDGLLPPNFL